MNHFCNNGGIMLCLVCGIIFAGEDLVSYKMFFRFVITLVFLNVGIVINCETSASLLKRPIDESKLNCKNGMLLSSSVCISEGYIKGEAPIKPTEVNTKIEINNIREVNDKGMRVTLDFYQELRWKDNRLKTTLSPNASLVLSNNLINSIWKPDLWIKNLFDFKLRWILEPTAGLIIADETFDGHIENKSERNTWVYYNMDAQATIYCNFNFMKYPMDTQYCEFIMDAAYPESDIVNLAFKLGVFGVTNKNLNLDDFKISVNFKNETGQTGINITIKLERCVLAFIIRYYLPCVAIIIVSLVNFLISEDSIPARTVLLVTQFLTLVNILIAHQVCICD